jgi:hypothetical protein
VHSVVFGGFAPASWQPASTMPAQADHLGLLRHRAGPGDCLQAAAGRGDRIVDPQAFFGTVILQREELVCELKDGYDFDYRALMARPMRGGESTGPEPDARDRSALHSSTRPARPASPRAWCATMAGTWWRSMVDERHLRMASSRVRCSGRRRMSAGWLAIPTSSMRRCCTAARPSCSRASRWARPMQVRSGG